MYQFEFIWVNDKYFDDWTPASLVTDNFLCAIESASSSSFSFSTLSVFFKLCGFYFRCAHESNLLIFTRNRSVCPSHTHTHAYTQ